jgi:NAD+ kinase
VRRVALVLRPERDLDKALQQIRAWAAASGVTLVGTEGDPRLPEDVAHRPEVSLADGCDLVLALGGDGTMLGALRVGAAHGVPVLGVNLGRLGYLTEVDAAHLDAALSALGEGEFTIEARTGLALVPRDDLPAQIAYNDVVLTRVPGRGQAALALRIDGELLVRYASDGVITATPHGSTAYAFAAGGPLVSPRAQGMIVMPDAPHGLFNRAVVLAERERLGIEVLPTSAPVSIERDGQLLGHADPGARSRSSLTPMLHTWCGYTLAGLLSARVASSASSTQRDSLTSIWPATNADPTRATRGSSGCRPNEPRLLRHGLKSDARFSWST